MPHFQALLISRTSRFAAHCLEKDRFATWRPLLVLCLHTNTAEIAQLVEQRTENPRVTSSSLVLGTKNISSTKANHIIKREQQDIGPSQRHDVCPSLTDACVPKCSLIQDRFD